MKKFILTQFYCIIQNLFSLQFYMKSLKVFRASFILNTAELRLLELSRETKKMDQVSRDWSELVVNDCKMGQGKLDLVRETGGARVNRTWVNRAALKK